MGGIPVRCGCMYGGICDTGIPRGLIAWFVGLSGMFGLCSGMATAAGLGLLSGLAR